MLLLLNILQVILQELLQHIHFIPVHNYILLQRYFPEVTIIYNQLIKVFIIFVNSAQTRHLICIPVFQLLLFLLHFPKNQGNLIKVGWFEEVTFRECILHLSHINPSAQSDDYIIPKVHIDKITHFNHICTTNGVKELATIVIDVEFQCHAYLKCTGKKFGMNCCNFYNLLLCYPHFLTYYYFFCVQIQVSWQIEKRNTWKVTYISIMLIFFWILSISQGKIGVNTKKTVNQAQWLLSFVPILFLEEDKQF